MRKGVRVFLLSAACLGGVRGQRILAGESRAPFMEALLGGAAVQLGEVFASISSQYFRGKLEYARQFARWPKGGPSVFIITASQGLVAAEHAVTITDLRRMATTDIEPDDLDYVRPVRSSSEALDRELAGDGDVVLLGSIASRKYLDPLTRVFGARLLVPKSFIGVGNMSRGSILLRAVAAGVEVDYVIVSAMSPAG